jgi:hypothetical protein
MPRARAAAAKVVRGVSAAVPVATAKNVERAIAAIPTATNPVQKQNNARTSPLKLSK